jgi:ABC-type phosphate/phosphonate transport system ATPase subunit
MVENKVIELVGAEVYQRENCILTDVELSIGQGEFVYIFGNVGTGISSLIITLTAELPLMKGMGNSTITAETGCGFSGFQVADRPDGLSKPGVCAESHRLEKPNRY